jgi:hypothetical protein
VGACTAPIDVWADVDLYFCYLFIANRLVYACCWWFGERRKETDGVHTPASSLFETTGAVLVGKVEEIEDVVIEAEVVSLGAKYIWS